MITDSQANSNTAQGLEIDSQTALAAPYRHKGYKKALNALREALEHENAVLLKGVEGTGKSTLVQELVNEYKHRAIPIVSLNEPLEKAAQLYAKIADSLAVAKEKKALINALRNTREAGQFCLVVVDQGAINSSAEVTQALHQLCQTSATTAGAIKLIVISKDYLVIHAEGTPQADFHDWIRREIKLNPLQTDDIEGFIYYLCALKNLQPTPYEIGTDFVMIEQTEGRIGRLKALLLPLIHKDVITRNDIAAPAQHSVSMPSLNKQRTGMIAAALILLLAAGVGLQQFIFSGKTAPNTVQAEILQNETLIPVQEVAAETRVFAEQPLDTQTVQPAVTLPSIAQVQTEPSATKKASITATAAQGILVAQETEEESLGVLPLLNPDTSSALDELPAAGLAQPATLPTTLPTDESVAVAVTETVTETTASLPLLEQPSQQHIAPSPEATEQTREEDIEQIVALPEEEFQKAIRTKLDIIEQELAAAIAENRRLQTALVESATQKAREQDNKAALPDPTTEVIHSAPDNSAPVVSEEHVVSDEVEPRPETESAQQTISPSVISTPTNTPVAAPNELAVVANTNIETDITTDNPEFNTRVDQAIAAIDAWQQAWQNQDHAGYTARYAARFNGAYTSHQRWLKKRYDALNRPEWIKLNREAAFNIYELENQVRIDFWLNYEASSGYKDRTLKRLTLVQEDNHWVISKEQNIKIEHPF